MSDNDSSSPEKWKNINKYKLYNYERQYGEHHFYFLTLHYSKRTY